jgi:hypothetical protein
LEHGWTGEEPQRPSSETCRSTGTTRCIVTPYCRIFTACPSPHSRIHAIDDDHFQQQPKQFSFLIISIVIVIVIVNIIPVMVCQCMGLE